MSQNTRRADQLAREHTEAAIQTLAEIMYDGDAKTADRIKAADSILDRGHGKPVQATITLPLDKQARDALYDMSDEELMNEAKRRMAERLPAPAPIDAEAIVPAETMEPATTEPKPTRQWDVADQFDEIQDDELLQ
jgi:hypothetical protein